MKTILLACALILSLARVDAANLQLNGDLTWNITEPQAGFKLAGKIVNLSASGTGSLRLALWATRTPYPSQGTLVAQYPLGQLPGGYQFTSFRVKTKATMPYINGNLHFTITLMEYTTAGWRNVLMVPTGTRRIYQAHIVGQPKWAPPAAAVIMPPPRLYYGNLLTFTEKATATFNKFPFGWQEVNRLVTITRNSMNFTNRNRTKRVTSQYSVKRKPYRGRWVNTGNLVVSYTGPNNISFRSTITLFFHRPNAGTYRSVTRGYLWDDSFGSTTTWGSFRYRP